MPDGGLIEGIPVADKDEKVTGTREVPGTPATITVAGVRGDGTPVHWRIAEEVAVAFEYNGRAHAVMMASPADLEDFAVGFTLAEEIVPTLDDIHDVRVRETPLGHVLDIRVDPLRLAKGAARARNLVGRAGCGICGMDSLASAVREPDPIPPRDGEPALTAAAVIRALAALPALQPMNDDNRSVHAAAWADRIGAVALVREDVGRHNALDKLIGAVFRAGISPSDGFALLTSRCGHELVQKAAVVGIPALASLSAPTALALRQAEKAGMSLAAADRAGGVVLFG